MKILLKATTTGSPLVGVGVFQGGKTALAKNIKFEGKCGETLLSGGKLYVGLGKREKFTLECMRRSASRLLSQAKALRAESAALDLDSFNSAFLTSEIASAAVEGLRLSDYLFQRYKSKPAPARKVAIVGLISKNGRESSKIKKAIAEAEIVSAGVIFTRDLANEPANVMTPMKLADSAKKMAHEHHLRCQILGPSDMKRLGMGGILGVARGSVQEPRFIILEHAPARALFKEPIVLVGKGITFDTGGISIKPSNDMDKMKFDMCGAAAVIGALRTISVLKLPVRVVGLVPTCENMPGGRAQRPGDIIKCLNGKTVEVLNTDAEGRLILADALAYAKRFDPKALVDIATLTGACSATFGELCSGLMSTDPLLTERLRNAGEKTGERLWELPLWDEYFDLIKATYADIQNISKKYAGTITAGMFLKEFADHTKSWAHLDVAGTAWTDNAKPLGPIGSTGVGVRLFVELVKSYL